MNLLKILKVFGIKINYEILIDSIIFYTLDLASNIVLNICLGRLIKLLKIYLGFKLVKSFIKYLDIAKAEIFFIPFLRSEVSTLNSLGKLGSAAGRR